MLDKASGNTLELRRAEGRRLQMWDTDHATEGGANKAKRIQSVERAIQILNLLASEPMGIRLNEIAARVGLTPQTSQSILRTLQANDLVSQPSPKMPYMLGPQVERLSRIWQESRDRGRIAQPAVEQLAERVNENTLLAELRGGQLVRLVEAQSRQVLTVRSSDDSVERLHAFATGKILLASLRGFQRHLIRRVPLSPLTSHTITSYDELEAELEKVATAGFAVSDEEVAYDTYALAVPVVDKVVGDVAGLGLFLPKQRLTPDRKDQLLTALWDAAREIESIWNGATDTL
jgi:DNA-binding IclR family transcriptional regulator